MKKVFSKIKEWSKKDIKEETGLFVMAIMFCITFGVLGFLLGQELEKNKAVDSGVAEYYIADDKITREFRYVNTK